MSTEERAWAWSEFRSADLGDVRRKQRLLHLATRVAQRPSGVVAVAVSHAAERQAAYDFLSNDAIRSVDLVEAMSRAALERVGARRRLYVVLDGSSISVSDPAKVKQVGSIGARKFPTRGLQTMTALGLAADGVPVGIIDFRAWARGRKSTQSRFRRRAKRATEMQYLTEAIESVQTRTAGVETWTVIDRGGDDATTLQQLARVGFFTVRAAQNRTTQCGDKRRKLFSVARSGKRMALRTLHLPATGKRRARTAVVEVRATRTALLLPQKGTKERAVLEVGVIEIRELSNRPDRVRWVLLTNHPVGTITEVDQVIGSYRLRWRIEEYHRTWKRGGCNIEQCQLRSLEGIRKWATLGAAVSARAERLKHLSRVQPDAPATIELSEVEIRALIVAKRQIKTRVEQVPDGIPTLQKATLWIADLGGFSGHYKKGRQPGATTICRGLERLAVWTDARIAFEAEQKSREK